MKTQSFPKLFMYAALCCMLVFTIGSLAGCKGSDGSNGANGVLDAPTTGTVSGTVKTSVGSVALAGVSVTSNPVVTGATATTGADGSYSLSLPGGSYTLTFAAANFTTATANVNVANGVGTPANVTLAEAAGGKPSVALVASGNNVGYGQDFTVTATATSPLGATLSYSWTGLKTSSTTNTGTATSQSFASSLAGVAAPANDPGTYTSPFIQDTRFGVLPTNADTRGTKSVTVKVDDGQGGITSVSVSVNSAPVQAGVKQVAVGIPVYLNSGITASVNAVWSLTPATGSALTATSISTVGTGTRNPWFTPDVEGAYVVTATPGGSMTIYAGKFVGAISGGGYTTKTFSKTDPKAGMFFDTTAATWWGAGQTSATYTNWPTVTQASSCGNCHDGSSAINVWADWQDTAHATFFARGLEGITSNSNSCVTCHTVGSDGVTVGNGGYDDLVASTGFKYTKGIGAWSQLTTSYPTVAAVANIQCENCHGAQGTIASGHKTAGSGLNGNGQSTSAVRVSYSSDDCGACHSSGTGHHNYSEWNTLNPDNNMGHSKLYQIDAGIRPDGTAGHAQSMNGSCARCHTAQGFVQYVDQLASGNAGTLPASVITWDKTTAQVQTCTACHDPHDATNPNQLRIYNSIQNTMAGFGVDGVGKGALCMACHNNRNGVQCASAPTTTGACLANGGALSATGATFLHEDNDTYAPLLLDSMHDASQAEVLMGRDFFFMGDSLPMLSKHANVEDSCVGCHMVLNPQTHSSHGAPAVSGHVFYIKDADVPTLCANCHGNGTVNGEALQTFVEDQLAVLGTKMSANFVSKINTALGTGNVYLAKKQISSAASATYFDGSFWVTGTLTSGGTTTTIKVSLTTVTTDAAGTLPVIGPNDDLKKGSWNWTMIDRDGSRGIHNPTLIQQVLTNSIAKF